MGFAGLIAIFALAIAGVVVGARLAEVRDLSRKVLALSGAILIAVSVVGILPEVAARSGWRTALLSLAVGFAALWAVDRFVYPICPACSHHHEHEAYGGHLHGFAAPLLIAIGVHSFLDGWGFAASGDGSHFLQLAFLLGIALHKIPEGLALGAIVRAAISSHWKSLLACVAAESMTLAGGAAAFGLAARLGAAWEAILLAGAAGTFVYLGYHALEGVIHERIRSTRLVRLLSGKHVL